MRRKIILDCDPGHDDAINILLALVSPELDVLGITTVFGNVDLAKTTHNANVVCSLVNKNVPLFAGASEPLLNPRISAESCHGASGLEGPNLPPPQLKMQDQHAALFIIESVRQYPHEVTLVPTGSLTNIALAMKMAPDIVPLIKEIVLMGGSTDNGNWTPAAEFNILTDPHAAHIVFNSTAPVTMFGLNVTHQAIANPKVVELFRQLHTKTGDFVAELLVFFKKHHEERYGWDGGALHDPMTVAYLLKPELFEFKSMAVTIDTSQTDNMGRTNCDVWGVLKGKGLKETKVAVKVDAWGFFKLIAERISVYP